jgi:hypothetical protein
MSRRKGSPPKVKKIVEVHVTVAVEPPPVEVKSVRPVPGCCRCGVKGAGKLCPRCSVVLGHSGQNEAHLYSKPITSMVGY